MTCENDCRLFRFLFIHKFFTQFAKHVQKYLLSGRTINRFIGLSVNRRIHRIGKFEKFQYRIGIVSANYKGKYRLISNCLF